VKVGVLLPNWVGDLAMATPALRLLRDHCPDARIVGVARPYLMPLLDGTTWLDHILPWEHHGRGWTRRAWRIGRQLRAERLDLLILLRASFFAGIVGRLSGAKRIVGYSRNGRSWLLTDGIAPLHRGRRTTPVSAVDDYLNLVESAIGLTNGAAQKSPATAKSRLLELATTAADESAADDLWQRLALPKPSRVMLLNTGGAYGSAKHWPKEYCVSLALRAADEFGLTTLILCGPRERELAASMEHAANDPRVRSLANEDTSFGVNKAIIRRARLLVTTDSGPRHIASALNTPTVVLFGPIDPRWSHNYQPDSIQLRLPLDCSPCGRRTCPLGHHRCMRELTVDLVLRSISQMLERTRGRQAA
jgi:heptosyltransferase-2